MIFNITEAVATDSGLFLGEGERLFDADIGFRNHHQRHEERDPLFAVASPVATV